MTTAIIVQARVGSTRLLGKVLKPLGPRSVLEEVLKRCGAVYGCDVVVCAIPDDRENEVLIPLAEKTGALVARGSAQDVLARYHTAAKMVGADVVMRVTSDCPLIDPQVCAEVLALRAVNDADYVCNNMPPSFPHGLDCEAFTADVLCRAAAEAKEAGQREHVTPWIRTHAGLRRFNLVNPRGSDADQRWTLDYPLDYIFFTKLFELLPRSKILPWQAVLDIVKANPDIAGINDVHHMARTG